MTEKYSLSCYLALLFGQGIVMLYLYMCHARVVRNGFFQIPPPPPPPFFFPPDSVNRIREDN